MIGDAVKLYTLDARTGYTFGAIEYSSRAFLGEKHGISRTFWLNYHGSYGQRYLQVERRPHIIWGNIYDFYINIYEFYINFNKT
jgi:hypothetical protein